MKNSIIEIEAVTQAQSDWTRQWHESPTPPRAGEPWPAIEDNHRMNFDLWHAEDMARRDDGFWTIKLHLLPSTSYRYWFAVDGKKGLDPENPEVARGASVMNVP